MSFDSNRSSRNERNNVKEAENPSFISSKPDEKSDFSQWVTAMTMVALLPEGIPSEFRQKLWLTLANKHLEDRGVEWQQVERHCLRNDSIDADQELDAQIVKDLHRTGYSLFRGKEGQENQVLLKNVLLAYARWNKAVGYCQGFNMLAGLFLQITDRNPSDTLKLMIYLIEGVLPESYFADNLLGLSIDMAVFRELLKIKLPRLSKHLNHLQSSSKDGITSYEPPLTNVFTMQWFLTLFCNCLPQYSVLRVWDLILLEGNEILLKTALAIWQILSEKILKANSADEFYSLMGNLTQDMLERDIINVNTLIKSVVSIGTLKELKGLREYYFNHINAPVPKNVKIDQHLKVYPKQNLVLDLGILKRQYTKLRQRQRQAHIIFNSAVNRHKEAPIAINHLMLGKTLSKPLEAKPKPRVQYSSSSSSSSDTELCDNETKSDSDDEISSLPIDQVSSSKIHDPIDLLDTELDKVKKMENIMSKTDDVLKLSSDIINSTAKDFCDTLSKNCNLISEKSARVSQMIQENNLVLHRILQKSNKDEDEVIDFKCTESASSYSLDDITLNPVELLLLDTSIELNDLKADENDEYGEFQSGLDHWPNYKNEIDDNLLKDNTINSSSFSNLVDDDEFSQFNYSLVTLSENVSESIFYKNSTKEPQQELNEIEQSQSELNETFLFNECSKMTDKNIQNSFINECKSVEIKSPDILDEYPFVKDLLTQKSSESPSKSAQDDETANSEILNFKCEYNFQSQCDQQNIITNLDLNLKSNRQSLVDLSATEEEEKSVFEIPKSSSKTSLKLSDSLSKINVFNPFPTQLGTRQTKEVPYRLGLYKT